MSASLLPNQLPNGRLQVRVAYGADLTDPFTWVWTDITSDVMQANGGGVTISPMGRSNEASVAQPAGCSFRLKNPTGTYTPYNPASANYPFVRLGMPVQVRVSLNGGLGYFIRFQGEAASISPGWDAQGKLAYVTLTATGITRRLGSGNKPIRSPLTRSILGTTSATLRQFWPCEDGQNSTQAASGLVGGTPLLLDPNGGAVQFGAIDINTLTSFGKVPGVTYGTGAFPQLKDAGRLTATFVAGSATSWTVQVISTIDIPTILGATVTPLEWGCPGSTYPRWQVIYDSSAPAVGVNVVRVMAINAAGTPTQVAAYELPAFYVGEWRIQAAQSGGNIAVTLKLTAPGGNTVTRTGTLTTATLAGISSMTLNPNFDSVSGDYGLGEVRIWDGTAAPDFITTDAATSAWTAYNGELADARITRLCLEEGIQLTVSGSSTTTMGPQSVDTLMNLLRECEAADLGYLFDGLGPGLLYISRALLYNQITWVTVNANSGQVPANPGPQPTNDDQRLINRVTVTRTNGSFVTVEDEDGPLGTAAVGVRDTRYVLNLNADSQLSNIAEWLIHLGTVEGMRYPQIQLDLAAAPELASTWATSAPTNRIDITNLSSRLTQHPTGTVSLLAEGWTEFLSSRAWRITVNCSSASPFDVAEVAHAGRRVGAANSTLSGNVLAGATTMTVIGHTWTQVGPFPFDLRINGWPVTVTNIVGTTFTILPSPALLLSGSAVRLLTPAVVALA